jgi:iron complex transport system substrate-binding protein
MIVEWCPVFAQRGEYSVPIEWQRLIELNPDVIVIMPCGYDVRRALAEYRKAVFPKGWNDIAAARRGRVYAVHASAYFSRPGPRLVDGVEILYSLIHEDFSMKLPTGSWSRV